MPHSIAVPVLMTAEIGASVLHASGGPFSAYSFRPVKEYVAVGGRDPRFLNKPNRYE
jgi:hypothetical protein